MAAFRSRVEERRTEKVAPDVAVRMSDSRPFLTWDLSSRLPALLQNTARSPAHTLWTNKCLRVSVSFWFLRNRRLNHQLTNSEMVFLGLVKHVDTIGVSEWVRQIVFFIRFLTKCPNECWAVWLIIMNHICQMANPSNTESKSETSCYVME